jgi:hypothetical protein
MLLKLKIQLLYLCKRKNHSDNYSARSNRFQYCHTQKSIPKKGAWVIRVQSKWINHLVYKKQLEIESDSSYIVAMQTNRPGYFDISQTKTSNALKAGKSIQLYLLLNPANPRLKIANRRVYLGSFAVN